MDIERDNCQHLCTLLDFAFEMKEKLEELNRHAFNNFKLRIGKFAFSTFLPDFDLAFHDNKITSPVQPAIPKI